MTRNQGAIEEIDLVGRGQREVRERRDNDKPHLMAAEGMGGCTGERSQEKLCLCIMLVVMARDTGVTEKKQQ